MKKTNKQKEEKSKTYAAVIVASIAALITLTTLILNFSVYQPSIDYVSEGVQFAPLAPGQPILLIEKFKNFGNYTAYNFSYLNQTRIGPNDGTVPKSTFTEVDKNGRTAPPSPVQDLGPGQEIQVVPLEPYTVITQNELDSIQRKQAYLIFLTQIKYEDALRFDHTKVICQKYNPELPGALLRCTKADYPY